MYFLTQPYFCPRNWTYFLNNVLSVTLEKKKDFLSKTLKVFLVQEIERVLVQEIERISCTIS